METRPAPISVRIPQDIKQWLTNRAVENHRSLNGEIVYLLMISKRGEATNEAA